ncbi:MAG: hypothetical protein LBK98_00430 [Peptococcaceae bacterium]|nr:hypothetical protein [Peptococcaceae bacterium]
MLIPAPAAAENAAAKDGFAAADNKTAASDSKGGGSLGSGSGLGNNTLEPTAKGGTGPLVGVGGTATTLAAIHLQMREYEPEAFLGCRIHRGRIEEITLWLEGLTAAERLALPGMMPGREDVLPWGLRILLAAMTYCRRDSVVVCDRDLLYGILVAGDELIL